MQRILVIEDDTDINRLLCRILAKAGYETTAAYSGTEAQLRLERETPDMIMLDLMLPGISGEEIIKMARTEMGLQIPILVLSARTALKNKVETITLGADDYITKPFNILEVKARIKAIMRRTAGREAVKPEVDVIESGDMRMDCESRRVTISGREVNLTAKEFDVLELLIKNPNKVYSREKLLNLIWGPEYPGDVRTVDVHIRRLREKIESNPSEPRFVHTKWGVGYFFRV